MLARFQARAPDQHLLTTQGPMDWAPGTRDIQSPVSGRSQSIGLKEAARSLTAQGHEEPHMHAVPGGEDYTGAPSHGRGHLSNSGDGE